MALYFRFQFLGLFWRENGRGRHAGAQGSGASRPDQKVSPRWGPFGSFFLSQNRVIKLSDPGPPPP